MRRASRLLASDLDGTLIAIRPEAADVEGVRALDEAARRARLSLAYVTGRHFALAVQGIAEAGLPAPDYLSCDVGTSLYVRDGDQFRLHEAFREAMRTRLAGAALADVRTRLTEVTYLTLQPPDRQAEFKLSYFVPGDTPADAAERVADVLAGADLDLQVVHSRDPVTGNGLIDVLPPETGKRFTLEFFRRHLELDDRALVFAGDSGNDRDALLSGCLGILVGNAPADLASALRREAAALGLADRLYVARAPGVQGVLEGCRHFTFL